MFFSLAGVIEADAVDTILPIIEKNCIQSHGRDGKVKGKVNLLEIRDASALAADFGVEEHRIRATETPGNHGDRK